MASLFFRAFIIKVKGRDIKSLYYAPDPAKGRASPKEMSPFVLFKTYVVLIIVLYVI